MRGHVYFVLRSAALCWLDGARAEAPAMPAGFGPHPRPASPERQLIPTVNVAPVQRWTDGRRPAAAAKPGHPRLRARSSFAPAGCVLPNGDVLVTFSKR